jgi:predicted Zn-dependent protease with MMP-like domain
MINPPERDRFDELLEDVLERLPTQLHRLLEEVPLIVEDQPAPALIHSFVERNPELNPRSLPNQLCGLYTGFPVTIRSIAQPSRMPDRIMLFRLGIFNAARYKYLHGEGPPGEAPDWEHALSEQIRITLLHEIGHHFGLDEDDLESLGYG